MTGGPPATTWLGLVLLLAGTAAADEPSAGIVIESVTPHFAAARGGLEVGDRFDAWSFADAPDAIEPLSGAFTLRELEREIHQGRPVTLHGWRGDNRVTLTPGHGRWRLGSRPAWPEELAQQFQSMLSNAETDVDLAERDAELLSASLLEDGDPESAAWVWVRLAAAAAGQGQWPRSTEFYNTAVEFLPDADFPSQKGLVHYLLASSLVRQNRFAEAVSRHERAIALESAVNPERLAIAANQVGMGQIARRQSDLPKAMGLFEDALWMQQRLAPDSLLVASTRQEIGRVNVMRGELDLARDNFRRAYELAEERDPGGVAAAGYLNALGVVDYMSADLASAERRWAQALEMKERLEPGSRNTASALHNMGLINRDRGDLREAESFYLRALALAEKLDPDSLSTARTLNNLGTLSLEQGDLRSAEDFHRRAYQLRKAVVPDSLELVVSLINLGNVARENQQLAEAIRFHEQALGLQQALAPQTQQHARILANLGVTAKRQGDLALAEQYFARAMQIYSAIAPGSGEVADIAIHQGELHIENGDFAQAAESYRQARQIITEVAPNTFRDARAWHGLARIAVARNQDEEAAAGFQNAVLALESQQLRLGGSEESRVRARSRFTRIYKDYIRLLLDNEQPEAAFEVLERSRAKELSNMLAERDLVFAEDISPELELERRRLAFRYEQKQSALFAAQDVDEQDSIRTELLAIRRERDANQRAIRDQAPGLAELQYPAARTFQEYRDSVPAGAAVLSFSVNDHHTDVFLLASDGKLLVEQLDMGAGDIAGQVKRFRYLMDAGRWDSEPGGPLIELAATLYDQLLAPVESSIRDAELLLIVPDGTLNVLPFAALRRKEDGEGQYLAEWKPSLMTNSLSIFAQLGQRQDRSNTRLVAFGNPDVGNPGGVDTMRGADDSDKGLRPLPWSATEVRNIADAYSANNTVYIGTEATEERAKSLPDDTRFLHFATHATLDLFDPLDAAVVLSLPSSEGQTNSRWSNDNGFLQVWEIYEDLRIDAELVTLSGCETALGSVFPGEGLIGLTRAFHYAGAKSVLASLWRVNDRFTSDLMTHFYRAVDEETSLARALQAAQVAMIRGEDAISPSFGERVQRWFRDGQQASRRHPYHWAGFVLNGRGE